MKLDLAKLSWIFLFFYWFLDDSIQLNLDWKPFQSIKAKLRVEFDWEG